MARRKDLTDMADDYYDEQYDDEYDEELEYMLDDIQQIVPKQFKRDYIQKQLENFDYDQNKVVEFLLDKAEQQNKKKQQQQKKQQQKQQKQKIDNKKKVEKKQQKEPQKKEHIKTDPFYLGRKNSRKYSVEEVTQLQYNKEKWNILYPQIQPQNPELKQLMPNTLNVGIFGHVDTGKSTLLGHLFYKMNLVDEKTMRKNKKEAQKIGKGTFSYAWILDEMEEERQKEQLCKLKSYDKKKIHFIDTPGHVDFIFNTMKGAAQTEVALMMIDAAHYDQDMQKKNYEKNFQMIQGNQMTHLFLLLNKMDMVEWSKEIFDHIQQSLENYFMKKNILNTVKKIYIPISAYKGENLIQDKKLNWYKGSCLLKELSKVEKSLVNNEINKPLRLTIKNVFKGINKKKGYGITAKIDEGILEIQDKILLMPQNKVFQVHQIYQEDKKADYAICGDTVDIIIKINKEEEFEEFNKGSLICSVEYPIPLVKKFKAKIYTMEMNHPIIPGNRFTFHIGLQQQSGIIKKLLQELDQEEKQIKKNPRVLKEKSTAIVEILLDNRLGMEIIKNSHIYGKIIIVDDFKTIAYGKIEELQE